MDDLTDRLSELGRAVAKADSPDEAAIADARRRFVRKAAPRPARSRLPSALLAAAALLFAAVGASLLLGTDPIAVAPAPRPIGFTVGEGSDGHAGQWLAASSSPVPLRFTEGTSISVAPHARVRVSELHPRGASVDIERGVLDADVTHTDAGEWTFRAGPYVVRVTGTRFHLGWDPASEELVVRMHEGSVEVIGPTLAGPQSVVAGQTLRAWLREGRVELRQGDVAVEEPAPVPVEEPAAEEPRREAASEARTPRPVRAPEPAPAAVAAPEWRSLLDAGSHAAALHAAERDGFGRVLVSAEPDDLYRLADAARLVGRHDRAREALVALRTRHGERGRTAFLLGRIATEAGDRAEAVRWLETHLDESPSGPFEEATLGRLIELQRETAPEAARERAEQYLARHPSGPYRELARRVAGR